MYYTLGHGHVLHPRVLNSDALQCVQVEHSTSAPSIQKVEYKTMDTTSNSVLKVPLCPVSNASSSLSVAILTSDSVDLQELAANSDHLITTLVGYLGNRPDENDELVEEKHHLAFERLREVTIEKIKVNVMSSRRECGN